MQGQLGHSSSQRRRAAGAVERAQGSEQGAGLLECAPRRGVEEGQVGGVGAPDGELEGQPGEIHARDLRIGMRPAGGVLQLRPKAVGHARAGASRPSRPLVSRGPGNGAGVELGQPAAGVEAGGAGLAAIDDHPHAFHGEAGLGDVGGQHHPPTARG